MLPDFLAMIGVRVIGANGLVVSDRSMALGVRFHHVTDEVFHDAHTTRALMRSAFAELIGGGLPRGPARGLAHVAVEMLIDAGMARAPGARAGYLSALESFDEDAVRLSGDFEQRRLTELVAALLERGIDPRTDVEPVVLLERLRRVFQRRPRLSWPRRSEASVLKWLSQAAQTIPDSNVPVFEEVKRGLRRHPGYPHFLPQ